MHHIFLPLFGKNCRKYGFLKKVWRKGEKYGKLKENCAYIVGSTGRQFLPPAESGDYALYKTPSALIRRFLCVGQAARRCAVS